MVVALLADAAAASAQVADPSMPAPVPTGGQASAGGAPKADPVPKSTERRCTEYVNEPDAPDATPDNDLQAVSRCLAGVRSAVQALADAPASAATTRDLILRRIDYKRLKKWIPGNKPEESVAWSNARQEQLETQRLMESTLKQRGLFAKFSAVLISGASLVDASQPKASGTPATTVTQDPPKTDSTASQAVGTVIWQSRHFGDQALERLELDWSLGGRLGMQPVLNLMSSAPAADAPAGSPTTVSAVHQNALVWTAGVHGHFPLQGIDSEIGFYGATGSSTLTSLPKAIGTGSGAILAVPLDGGGNRTAWLWESGLTFDIFDNALEQIHAEGGAISPQFQALVALRRDDRFAGSAYSSYRKPESRLLFRLTLDAIRVLDKRQLGEPGKTFTFGFVVEHERGMAVSGPRVPAATRFLLRGDLNLLNAIAGTPPAAATSEAQKSNAVTHTWTAGLPGSGLQTLTLSAVVPRVSVALKGLVWANGQGRLSSTPPPIVVVNPATPQLLAIPTCGGAAIRFALEGRSLVLTTSDWGVCGVGAADFVVEENPK